jgi:hypothetical protein
LALVAGRDGAFGLDTWAHGGKRALIGLPPRALRRRLIFEAAA